VGFRFLLDSGLHVRATDARIPTVQFRLSISTILLQFLAVGHEFAIRVHSGRHTGQQRNDHVVVSVSAQSHSVVTSAGSCIQAYRLRLLIGDMIYSFLPVDRDISEFPLILPAEWPTEPASCDDQASMVRGA
jgi:hypothetical protein